MNVELICLGMKKALHQKKYTLLNVIDFLRRRFRVHAIAEFYQDLRGAIQRKHYTIMKAQIMLSDC